MKLLLIVVLALVGTAFALKADCETYGAAEAEACLGSTDQVCKITKPDAEATADPVTFVGDGVDFVGDKLEIEFTEAVTYYGKQFDKTETTKYRPTLSFGAGCSFANQAWLTWTEPTYNWDALVTNECVRTWKVSVDWASLINEQCVKDQRSEGETVVDVDGNPVIRYQLGFSVTNYELVDVSRQSSTGVYTERTVEHALPFTIEFRTTVAVSSVVRVYSPIEVQGAIVSQVVTMDDVVTNPNEATMVLDLYTSIQYPFELKLFYPSEAYYRYDTASDQWSAATVPATRLETVDNPDVGVKTPATSSLSAGHSCDATEGLCQRTYTFTFSDGTRETGDVCNFNGDYLVPYDVVCRTDQACPLNPETHKVGETGTTTDVYNRAVGEYNGLFKLTIASSDHCAAVVDTIELTAGITSYRLDETDYEWSTFVPFTANNVNPLSSATDPVIVSPTVISDAAVNNNKNSPLQTASNFLDGQHIIFAVDVNSDDATMTELWMNEITIKDGDAAAVTMYECVNGECGATGTTSGVTMQGKDLDLKHWGHLSTYTNIASGATSFGWLYFGFEVKRANMGIDFDANKPLTIAGTVEVKYLAAGQASTGFQVASVKKLALGESGNAGTTVATTASFVGPSSSGSSTLGGASATVVGAAGLALGVLAGVILGVLIRKKREPVKSESKVELTAEV